MEDYEKILEDAIASYKASPFETKELYKKYMINMQIPSNSDIAKTNGDIENLKRRITEESELKFDLIGDGEDFSTKNEFVKIVKNSNKSDKEEKEYETHAEKLGNYIKNASKNAVVVNVPEGKKAKLNFLFLCGDTNLPIQIIVNVGRESRLDVFEWFGSASDRESMVAPFHVINAGKDSHVELNMLHNEGPNTTVGALNRATTLENSKVRINAIYNGGKITKSVTFAEAAGKGSDLLVNEIVFGHLDQKFDINTLILNSSEFSRAVLKSGAVLKGKSFCILKGYAKVAKNTRGSYSNVEEKGLVMDPDARIQPLPDMSIDCKDVAFASHSASTAPVDKEALFYLMSRGIDEAKAKRVFVASFISKYLASIENDIVKEIAISIMLDKLDNGKYTDVPRISMQNLWIVPTQKT